MIALATATAVLAFFPAADPGPALLERAKQHMLVVTDADGALLLEGMINFRLIGVALNVVKEILE